MAGPVVGAEVEVLVAEEVPPAGLALAGVGRGAGPVDAARVPLTLVTPRSLPTLVASRRRTKLILIHECLHHKFVKNLWLLL